jgi:hypothetical protein
VLLRLRENKAGAAAEKKKNRTRETTVHQTGEMETVIRVIRVDESRSEFVLNGLTSCCKRMMIRLELGEC